MRDIRGSERERLLLEEAAHAFVLATGMRARPAKPAARGPAARLDGQMHFDLGHQRVFSMPVEVKARVDRFAVIARLREIQEGLGEDLLLVTSYLSPEMAERLRDNQISFIDTAGNLSLNRPEALLYVVGRREREAMASIPRGRSGSPKQLEILYTLLTRPELLSASYRVIASATQVAVSTVNVAIDDFLARHLLVVGADGKRQFGDWDRVIEEWTTFYPIKLKPKLASRRFSAADANWWKSEDIFRHGAVFSGEVAAARLTHDLRPQRLLLYAPTTSPRDLILSARLRADPLGDIEIAQAFWPAPNPPLRGIPPDVAHPILVYADLIDSGESRNLDIARKIREEYLGNHTLDPARPAR